MSYYDDQFGRRHWLYEDPYEREVRGKADRMQQLLSSPKPSLKPYVHMPVTPTPNPGGTGSMTAVKKGKKKHVVTEKDFEYGSAEYYDFLAKRQRKAEKKQRKAERKRLAEVAEVERVRDAKRAEADDRLRTAITALEKVAAKGKDESAVVEAANALLEYRTTHATSGY